MLVAKITTFHSHSCRVVRFRRISEQRFLVLHAGFLNRTTTNFQGLLIRKQSGFGVSRASYLQNLCQFFYPYKILRSKEDTKRVGLVNILSIFFDYSNRISSSNYQSGVTYYSDYSDSVWGFDCLCEDWYSFPTTQK